MIFFYCPDDNVPSGGIRKIYRHVDVLNAQGFAAAVVHAVPGFRCTWFANQTAIVYAQNTLPGVDDIMVIPEIYGPHIARTAPGIRKVIFNQNCYNTFRNYPIDAAANETPYLHPDVVAVITVSQDGVDYLRYAFPRQRVLRVHNAVDAALFFPGKKRSQIAFMPRRQVEDARQVFNILKFRGALEGFDIVEIGDMAPDQVAKILRESAIFLSFSGMEGFGLPPAEAMASGCLTIGFHGRGGAEYFRPEFSWPVAFGDIEGFARAAEDVLRQYRQNPASHGGRAAAAAQFICDHYSNAIEQADIVDCWRQISGAAQE